MMQKIDLREIIISKFPKLESDYPKIVLNLIINIFALITKVNKINEFLEKNKDKIGFDFIDELFEYLNFSYYVSGKDKLRIPSEGRVICVANHPLGALDGLSILRAISEVRSDVKIVANDILMNLDPLKSLFLPIDLYSPKAQKRNIELIEEAMVREEVLIFFPAAEVSRVTPKGIRDKDWQRGALKFAKKYNAQILPINVRGKNSILFYIVSFINKNFATALLPREMFSKKSNSIILSVGNIIPSSSFVSSKLNDKAEIKLLKKHTYNIGYGKPEIFKTEKNIIHPVSKKELKYELAKSEILGYTKDGKKIFLVAYPTANFILKEISRLREITYRKVGEGTGNKYDIDVFDKFYKHIVLWDESDLEIVGSYRLGVCKEILENQGIESIYNSQQFDFDEKMIPYLKEGLELGRSFIQQKYWGSNALDYLWQGIGAYLNKYDDIRYLFGAVSISANYPEEAKNLIVSYYKKWYSNSESLCFAKNQFNISTTNIKMCNNILIGEDYNQDMKILKNILKNYGMAVPVLLRKYTEICEYGAISFLDFGIDESFNNSIDCFIFVDLHFLKDEFKSRYLSQKSFLKITENVTKLDKEINKEIELV